MGKLKNWAEKILSVMMVIGLVVAMVGCATPTPAPEPTAEPAAAEPTAKPAEPEVKAEKVLKVGILAPYSGPSARTGEEFKGGATMAFDAINWQIGDYKIEPVWIDSQSDPAKASQAYEQAVVQDGIQVAILNWHSSVSVSCMEVAAKHKVPHIFAFGATEVVNETFHSDMDKYGYWTSKGWPTPKKLSLSYVQMLEDAIAAGTWTPADKTVAIYGEDTDWGRSFGGAIKKQLEEVGWKTVAEEYFDIGQTEFYPLLNKFNDLNPAVVAGTSTAAPSISAFIKQADEVGLDSLIIADGLGWVGEWYDLTGTSSNHVIDQIPAWATEEGKAFAEEFNKKYGLDASPSAAGLSYDGTNMFIGIAKATLAEKGELNSETIYDFVKNKVWTGEWTYTDGIVMQEYKYTMDTIPDPVVGKGYYIFPVLQYFDGVGKVVYPPEWAEQKLAPKGAAPEMTAPAAEAPAEEATETFKLGILGPFSGPSARTGEEFKASATMAFDEVNWQIGKYKIEPVWIDSQSDPAKASQAYEQAVVQDGIQAGVLNWHSSVAVACMEVTAKHKVPHFFGFGATEVVNETFASDPEKYGYWMFKGWPTPKKLSISYVQMLEQAIEAGTWTPAEKTVAIYGEDTDWGRSFGGGIKEQLEERGWKTVAEEYFDIGQTEFYPLLNKFKDLNPAVIAGTSTAAPSISAFIKQADEVGLESLIVADGLGWVGEWYDLTGTSSNYVIDQIPGWATEEGKAYAEKFRAEWGIEPSPSSGGLSYDGTKFFIAVAQEAYKEYGELSSEAIYNFVKNNVWTGKWSFKDGIVMTEYAATAETVPDPIVGQGYYIFPVLQYFDGDGKVIYPPEWAEQQLAPKGAAPEAAAPAAELPAEEATETFKLGILGPFSGPSARTGEEFKASATMAFDEVNWQIGKYKVEPVWIDSQSDPAKASQAYEQAVVQDGIQAGVLNWHSSVAVACMEVTAKHKVPHFFGFGATEVVNETFASDPEKYGYWMFKGWPTPKKLSISYVQMLEQAIEAGTWTPAEKTVAIYGEDTDWGRSFGGGIKEQLEERGWKTVAEEYFDIGQTEFYPLLNKFNDLNPAVIAGTSTAAPSISAFIKQADEVGLKSLIIADGLGWVGEWYDLTGTSSNYVIDQIPGWATEEGKAYAEKFRAEWGIEPSPSSGGLSYDGTKFFIAVAQAAYKEYGELSSEVIYNFVKDNVWTGKWSFKDGIVMTEYAATAETVPDPIVGQGYYIFPVLQYFDGDGKVVYPPEWAEQQLAPKP